MWSTQNNANDTRTMNEHRDSTANSVSRRTVLKRTVASGTLVGLTGNLAQDGGTTIRLGGKVSGWQGMSPGAIKGQKNPTLNLKLGEKYTVVWKNLDGQPHDFVIQNDSGKQLVKTKIMNSRGQTQSVSFIASKEMTKYLCTVHPDHDGRTGEYRRRWRRNDSGGSSGDMSGSSSSRSQGDGNRRNPPNRSNSAGSPRGGWGWNPSR